MKWFKIIDKINELLKSDISDRELEKELISFFKSEPEKYFQCNNLGKFRINFTEKFFLSSINGLFSASESGQKIDWKNVFEQIKKTEEYSSNDVEIAVVMDGDYHTKEMAKDVFNKEIYDNIMGYIGLDDWIKIIIWGRNFAKKLI